MTRCCKHVVCSVHLCSNSKDRRSVCLDKLGLRRQLSPRRIKGKAIHIQTKCVVVFKSSQVLLVLIMWKAAGSNEKDGDPPKKRYILGRMPRGKKDKSRERGQRDHDEEQSAADQSFYALLLWFINMNVLMKIDEYYQRDTQDFVQNCSWIMWMLNFWRRSREVLRN